MEKQKDSYLKQPSEITLPQRAQEIALAGLGIACPGATHVLKETIPGYPLDNPEEETRRYASYSEDLKKNDLKARIHGILIEKLHYPSSFLDGQLVSLQNELLEIAQEIMGSENHEKIVAERNRRYLLLTEYGIPQN